MSMCSTSGPGWMNLQCEGMPPSMRHLYPESFSVGIVELGHILKVGRILGHQRALAEEMKLVIEAVSLSKGIDVRKKICLWNACKRILDLAGVVVGHGGEALLALTTPGIATVPRVRDGGVARRVSARAHQIGGVWVFLPVVIVCLRHTDDSCK